MAGSANSRFRAISIFWRQFHWHTPDWPWRSDSATNVEQA